MTKRADDALAALAAAAVGYSRALRTYAYHAPGDAEANVVLNRADLFAAAVEFGNAHDRFQPAHIMRATTATNGEL